MASSLGSPIQSIASSLVFSPSAGAGADVFSVGLWSKPVLLGSANLQTIATLHCVSVRNHNQAALELPSPKASNSLRPARHGSFSFRAPTSYTSDAPRWHPDHRELFIQAVLALRGLRLMTWVRALWGAAPGHALQDSQRRKRNLT